MVSQIALNSPLLQAFPRLTPVLVPLTSTTGSSPITSGSSVITVDDPSQFHIGQTIGIGEAGGTIEYRQIIDIIGNDLYLSAPLGNGYPSGIPVVQAPEFLTGIGVFTKAGYYLGQITDYTSRFVH